MKTSFWMLTAISVALSGCVPSALMNPKEYCTYDGGYEVGYKTASRNEAYSASQLNYCSEQVGKQGTDETLRGYREGFQAGRTNRIQTDAIAASRAAPTQTAIVVQSGVSTQVSDADISRMIPIEARSRVGQCEGIASDCAAQVFLRGQRVFEGKYSCHGWDAEAEMQKQRRLAAQQFTYLERSGQCVQP